MDAIADLRNLTQPDKVDKIRAYHKTDREVLGITSPQLDELVKAHRSTPEADIATARLWWRTGIFEGRIAAGKMLTRRRLPPELDRRYWAEIIGYIPEFDGWAIADQMASAGHRRILNTPDRYLDLEPWTDSDHLWGKRAALVFTLPYARLKTPDAEQSAAIDTILGWAAGYVPDREWFIQKAIGWWLRDLSRRQPHLVRTFLDRYSTELRAVARNEATKYLPADS